jgi:hypothetical protein
MIIFASIMRLASYSMIKGSTEPEQGGEKAFN